MQKWHIHLEIEVPVIKSYSYRKRWQERFDSETTVVAIYNTGRNLFFDPFYQPATTHYDPRVWEWIRYQDFCEPRFIMANKNFCSEKPIKPDMMVLQHLGHDEFGTARVLTISSPNHSKPEHTRIPRYHIMYLAVKKGYILGSTVVFQPLPFKLFNTINGYCLNPVAKWYPDAKQLKFFR